MEVAPRARRRHDYWRMKQRMVRFWKRMSHGSNTKPYVDPDPRARGVADRRKLGTMLHPQRFWKGVFQAS